MLFFDCSKLGVLAQSIVIVDDLETADDDDAKLRALVFEKEAVVEYDIIQSPLPEPVVEEVSVLNLAGQYEWIAYKAHLLP